MNANAALCYLMGVKVDPPSELFSCVPAGNEQTLLLALSCAQAGRVEVLTAMLDMLDAAGIALLSSQALMVGLNGQLHLAFSILDVLKRRFPGEAVVWLALTQLQIAWGYLVPALRSDAMHRQLTNQSDVERTRWTIEVMSSEPGPIHFLNGDVVAFRAR